jgi:hypothetical protein
MKFSPSINKTDLADLDIINIIAQMDTKLKTIKKPQRAFALAEAFMNQ